MTAGPAAISGWTVTWPQAGGQISQVWGGTLSAADNTITVRNEAWNGAVAAHGSTTFGLIGTGTAPTPAPTCATR